VPKFGVWCEVSGGVTGSRCAWLKRNGVRAEFDAQAEAEAEAARLMSRNGSNPYRTADFRYTAREI